MEGRDAADRQFFIVFLFWAMLFTLYILVFMIIQLARSSSIDGQVIGLVAVYVNPRQPPSHLSPSLSIPHPKKHTDSLSNHLARRSSPLTPD